VVKVCSTVISESSSREMRFVLDNFLLASIARANSDERQHHADHAENMGRALRTAALAAVAVSGAQAFAPAAAGFVRPALRSCATSAKPSSLALRMNDENTEYKPVIPTADNSMAPDYAREPTQFERQGLVDSGASVSSVVGATGGGLTRREVYGVSGAAGAGVLGVVWALTRNIGYDRKSSAREAGKVTINAEAIADPKIMAAIAALQENRSTLNGLFEEFKKDKNVDLSDGVAEFELTSIRNNLNSVNLAAFDEDTQILTDRLSRNIIQVCLPPRPLSRPPHPTLY